MERRRIVGVPLTMLVVVLCSVAILEKQRRGEEHFIAFLADDSVADKEKVARLLIDEGISEEIICENQAGIAEPPRVTF